MYSICFQVSSPVIAVSGWNVFNLFPGFCHQSLLSQGETYSICFRFLSPVITVSGWNAFNLFPGFCHQSLLSQGETYSICFQVSVTSLLQTVCLAAGMRACPDDIGCLAAQCRGDIRHALLTLQFLTLSGGGWNKEPRPVIIGPTQKAVGSEKKPHKGRESLATKSSGLSAAGDENDSDGDFMSLKPLRKKARRIVDDDDDAEDGSSAVASVSAGANTASESERQDGVVVSADRLPLVHLHLHESLLSVSRDLHALFIKCMKVRMHVRLADALIEFKKKEESECSLRILCSFVCTFVCV